MNKDLLRKLPKVDELIKLEFLQEEISSFGRQLVLDTIRQVVEDYRKAILENSVKEFSLKEILDDFQERFAFHKQYNLRKVINASGVIIHTNLGRSILPKNAIEHVLDVAGSYSNLEFDLVNGSRGSRYVHIEEIIKKITGAEAAMVVNNNAAAILLVLDTMCKGKEVIVSRGQLVEIGGSFRIPEVMSFSGAKLIEVGTTNRTHLYDYEGHINDNTGALLKVHTSNFKIIGFTEEVSLEQLVELGDKRNIPVIEDIGSGVLVDFSKYGFTYEPTVQESVRKGIDVLTFSGDKLLGGPQAGIIVGKKHYIERMRKNQLARALRIDKMTLAALEATLRLYLDEVQAVQEIPTLHMILSSKDIHKKRAFKLKKRLESLKLDMNFKVKEDFSKVGGGSMPAESIETFAVYVKSESYSTQFIETKLRRYKTPIVARISAGEIILDLRTILDNELDIIVDAFKNIGESIS